MRYILRSTLVMMLLCTVSGLAPAQDRVRAVVGTPNNQARVVNTYPEYWVDGKPFFEHSSAFFYHRLPRDRWAEELMRLKELGINTIDLYTMWNWQEPEDGVLDFDGHTNPRRDLKYLVHLLDLLGFKITVRPGPFFCSEWRNGGYPDWLLRRPEYRTSEQAILEGRYPRLSALQYDKSEEAAAEWLKNETHLRRTHEWYHDVLSVFNPLLADKGGPVISIQLDDDQAIGRENYNGPNFYKYMETLRRDAREATHSSRIPYYLNGADMRVNAEANDALAEPLWNTGQDYQMSGAGGLSTIYEAAKNKFLTELLKTEPDFVPTIIEFQAGWLLDEKDTYARPTDPTNTLMASRVMFQNGLKALNYYPLNDTLYPAGYEAPWGNYFYTWEAAVNYAGQETGRAVYVRRNGRLLEGMGPLLGSAHLLADAALVYPIGTFPQAAMTPAEAGTVANFAARVLWSGTFDGFNFELMDSDHTPPENFARTKTLLLPNFVSTKEQAKRFPHLERYSEKAQRMMEEYVAAGGTLVVFPSLPKGKVFDDLLQPLGEGREVAGNAPLRFVDGASALALGARTTLALPRKPRAEVKVFARDSRGGTVGARFAHGRGQVIFFGADFSLWSAPGGSSFTFGEGGQAGTRDYAEEAQKSARQALPALMKEVGVARHAYAETPTAKARELGLYTTELVADAEPRPFGSRAAAPRYGFLGITNFSPQESRPASPVLTDPRAADLHSPSPEGRIELPRMTLPPRESLLLPVRLPLANPFWRLAPGLEPSDEIYYATAELSRVDYDGATLGLEFTAPAEGEVALRLAARPQSARANGQETALREDAQRHLWVVKIPRGAAPHFVTRVELSYPRGGPRATITARDPWIAGEPRAVRVRVENPALTPFEGQLDFEAGSLYRPENPPLAIHIPARSSREFSFPVEIPAEAPEGQRVDLVAILQEAGSPAQWSWSVPVTIHRPFEESLARVASFPLREDQAIPIVHPILASLDLPGQATFHLRVKNWLEHEQVVTFEAEGKDLALTPASSQLVLAAGEEKPIEITAAPQNGTGVYHFEVRLHAGDYQVKEGAVLVALQPGEAVAYTLDYDRDGFADLILENQRLRLFLSPHAGGRSFALVRKETGTNAFDSVGAMRDNFSTRFEPEDMKGLPDWTNVNWLGLYNRPYGFTILSAAGPQARVKLSYDAPDIYPQGVKLERTLTLGGAEDAVLEETALTPAGVEKPQSYVLESSVPFRSFAEPNYNEWFASPRHGKAGSEPTRGVFTPLKNIDLGADAGFVGTVNKKTGETFALFELTPGARTQFAVDNHSALIRVTFPPFADKEETYKYRVGYYFGKAAPGELEKVLARLK